MKYEALVTLDLPEVDDKVRKTFYEELESAGWVKLEKVTTAWEAYGVAYSRKQAEDTIYATMREAKKKCDIEELTFAVLVSEKGVIHLRDVE